MGWAKQVFNLVDLHLFLCHRSKGSPEYGQYVLVTTLPFLLTILNRRLFRSFAIVVSRFLQCRPHGFLSCRINETNAFRPPAEAPVTMIGPDLDLIVDGIGCCYTINLI